MKTNRLFSLFACLLFSAVMMAEVVYEHLLVDSGFNRDVIAEAGPSTQYAKSYLIADTTVNYWSMATQSVIRTVNTNSGKFTGNYAYEIETTAASGWPDDLTGDPANRIIHVEESVTLENPLYAPVTWQLAAYDKKNVLTIRPVGGTTGYDPSGYSPGIQNGVGSLKFKKVGCYDKVFFLIAAAKENGAKDPREVKTIVHYTNGDTTQAKFTFGGLSGKVGNNVRRINIYESQYKKNTHLDGNNAYAMVFDMPVDPTKLISKIEFKNELVGTAVIIFAVTGRTADVEAPDEEAATVSDIDKTSFQACWDAITEAASYRIDVATDIDFQHILEDYNNLPVSGSTCQDIVDLVSNTDYYWRVRSVNADGGQSASSVPMHVKTAGGDIPETNEDSEDIAEQLDQLLNTAVPEIDIHRTLYKDGYFNTICLPFNLTETQLTNSPLAGGEVYEFTEATQLSTTQLDIQVQQVSEIRAGYPYLIRWDNTNEVIPSPLVFRDVYISDNEGKSVGEGIQFVGHVGRVQLDYEDTHNLFLGEQNTLYWPINDGTTLRGFRAHFAVPTSGKAAVPRGTAARIVEKEEVATDFDVIVHDDTTITRKRLVNGQLVIEHDGRCYNVLGVEL